jgi:succinyl-CoA synthetase beta subunit
MKLLEHESKQIFQEFGIPTLKGVLITTDDDIREKLEGISYPAIVKAQVPIGSRKKRGLIREAADADECLATCKDLLGLNYEGIVVGEVLVEELATIQKEYYVSIALDTFNRQFTLITSGEGGIDIEAVSQENPEAILKEAVPIDEGISEGLCKQVLAIEEGVAEGACNEITARMGIPDALRDATIDILRKLWDITVNVDAELVEINPLALADQGLIALDGKMILDDNAAYRRPIIQELAEKKNSDLEKIAAKEGFSFVKMDGDIGILANGAGLTLALVDVLADYGLNPANFLDVGGGASADRVTKALELIFSMKPHGVLINIFGGITRCDVVAEGVVQALATFGQTPPMAIRLSGTNEKEGAEILDQAGLHVFPAFHEAAEYLKNSIQQAEADA